MSSHDSGSNPPPTVPWNEAFTSLLPLAAATMTQPVGSVLCTSSISRMWLRSNPIFCVADCLDFIVHVIAIRLKTTSSLRRACSVALEKRFEDVEEQRGEDMTAFRRTTLMRWIFAAMGTYASFFKIAAATGLPGTTTLGWFYISSFVFFEAVMLLSYWLPPRGDDGRRYAPLLRPHWILTRKVAYAFLGISSIGYAMLLIWALMDIGGLDLVSIRPDDSPWRGASTLLFAPSCLLFLMVTLVMSSVLIQPIMSLDPQSVGFEIIVKAVFSGILWVFCAVTLVVVAGVPYGKEQGGGELWKTSNSASGLVATQLTGAMFLHSIIWPLLARASPRIARQLLISTPNVALLQPNGMWEEHFVWGGWLKSMPLTLFICNLIVAAAWYRYRYDPSGTSYPAWTDTL